jgi:hypothetical protein
LFLDVKRLLIINEALVPVCVAVVCRNPAVLVEFAVQIHSIFACRLGELDHILLVGCRAREILYTAGNVIQEFVHGVAEVGRDVRQAGKRRVAENVNRSSVR